MIPRVYPHELIGLKIVVTKSSNKSEVGMRGQVVGETKMALIVEQDGRSKTVLKKNVTLALESGVVLEGKDLLRRPEERIKGR